MTMDSPVKIFLSSRQAGYSNRQQRPKLQGPCPEYKSDKCGVSGRYYFVGGQPAHFDWAAMDQLILQALHMTSQLGNNIFLYFVL